MRRAARSRAAGPRYFATAAKGTEGLLTSELVELGLPDVRATRGGVRFGATREHALRACLWSRVALRILEPLAEFPCRDGDELYDGVRRIDWSQWFGGTQTLAVRASGRGSLLTHSHFIAVRTKDAIVDQLREQRGCRPSVDRQSADVVLFVHLAHDVASVNLDYSGASLHEHGYRGDGGDAPLRENLAAALVRFSGWGGDGPVIDPMCGSGTLLIEAALWAARRAPGLGKRFGFERWSSYDASFAACWRELTEEAVAGQRTPPPLFGSDTDENALRRARDNAARMQLDIELVPRPLQGVEPPAASGLLLANPPYGKRLAQPERLAGDLAELLQRFSSHQRALIVPAEFPVSLRASRWLPVFNGALPCELRRYDRAGGRDVARERHGVTGHS